MPHSWSRILLKRSGETTKTRTCAGTSKRRNPLRRRVCVQKAFASRSSRSSCCLYKQQEPPLQDGSFQNVKQSSLVPCQCGTKAMEVPGDSREVRVQLVGRRGPT